MPTPSDGAPQRDVAAKLLRMLESAPEFEAVGGPLEVRVDEEGRLSLEGEVRTVGAKRRAVERAGLLADAIAVVDRLRVAPERRMGDEEIRRRLLDLLVDEAAFADYDIRGVTGPDRPPAGGARAASAVLDFNVDDGVIALYGTAASLEHKRLAGVLAWWTPGARDVANHLEIASTASDDDEELTQSVRAALDKDPLVDDQAIEVLVAGGIVRLAGTVHSEDERQVAEADAWYVLGVHEVVNDIRVDP